MASTRRSTRSRKARSKSPAARKKKKKSESPAPKKAVVRKKSPKKVKKKAESSSSNAESAEFKQLKRDLLRYKYVSPNLSLTERLFLNDFWALFPKYVSLPSFPAPVSAPVAFSLSSVPHV